MSMFQHRHYEAIASALKERRKQEATLYGDCSLGRDVLERFEFDLIRMFRADNPRFDAGRFAKACEYNRD